MNSINFGLLKFCLEHADDPNALVNSQIDTNRDPKDYEFLVVALQNLESDLEKAYKLLTKLTETQDNFEIKAYLEGLQYFCEDLDVSQGIVKKQGIELVVSFINHEDEEIRYISAWVLASSLQSNPMTQNYALKINVLEKLVDAMLNENNVNTMGKQLYALSSFLSENFEVQKLFVENCSGVKLLNKYLPQKVTEEYVPVKAKAIWILSKLIDVPSIQPLLVELETLKFLFKILEEDQNIVNIRKNTISFLTTLIHKPDLSPVLVNHFKENNLPNINESLCDENEIQQLRSFTRTQAKLKTL